MSMPLSPRVPMSPDLSRRRMPRAKDKRRALRDFYGLQQSQNNGPVEHDALLDGDAFDVTTYLAQVKADVKSLLKLENAMIRDIRVLDGERKALVYDNYGKMISTTGTLKEMTTALQPISSEAFEPILTMIRDLNTAIEAEDARQAVPIDQDHGGEADSLEDIDAQWRDWTRSGPARIEQLIADGEHAVALLEWTDVQERTSSDLDPNTKEERDSFARRMATLRERIDAGTQQTAQSSSSSTTTTEEATTAVNGEGVAKLTIDTATVNGVF